MEEIGFFMMLTGARLRTAGCLLEFNCGGPEVRGGGVRQYGPVIGLFLGWSMIGRCC